jgi:hypothetical protein
MLIGAWEGSPDEVCRPAVPSPRVLATRRRSDTPKGNATHPHADHQVGRTGSDTLTQDDSLSRFRLRLRAITLPTELGRSCGRAMRIHPSTFYGLEGSGASFGPEILMPRGTAAAGDGLPDLTTHRAAGVSLALGAPGSDR